jgi:hypothetical protein
MNAILKYDRGKARRQPDQDTGDNKKLAVRKFVSKKKDGSLDQVYHGELKE